MVLALSDVLQDPAHACRVLEDELFGVAVDRVLVPRRYGGVVLDLSFTPLPELAIEGYGSEQCRVSVRPGGDIYAFPLGAPRTWRHRNPSPLGSRFGYLAGDLCLWYPQDSRSLRWEWGDGLEQYVTRAYRHLFYEEYARRTGEWPIEDAPHAEPNTGAHPVRSAFMRKEERRWAS
ncbi:MAG TPA: hypothetical protein VI452_17210 [Marmoricola sp.]